MPDYAREVGDSSSHSTCNIKHDESRKRSYMVRQFKKFLVTMICSRLSDTLFLRRSAEIRFYVLLHLAGLIRIADHWLDLREATRKYPAIHDLAKLFNGLGLECRETRVR